MLLPIILIFFATLSSAIATYGTLPHWIVYNHGMQIIQTARHLQWPLLTLSVFLSVALVVLIITGKRRVWWIIGLGPVVAMFLQLFVTGSMSNLQVIEQPATIAADKAALKDDDYVVGITVGEKTYALPYRQLFACPVVFIADRDNRVMLMWSAYANRALAFHANRQMMARELDIVSMPGNALLIYNGRLGQFINGVTGLTTTGEKPYGLSGRVPTSTMTWKQWRQAHSQTVVTEMPTLSTALPLPLQPQFPMRTPTTVKADRRVVFFPTTQPVAVPEDRISEKPLNVELGTIPATLFRDPQTGRVKVFDRRFADITPRFIHNFSPRRAAKGVYMLDTATNSGWNTNGVAIDGDEKVIGSKLTPITSFDEDLYLGVMRNWYADLVVVE